jgi:hypothetical protein
MRLGLPGGIEDWSLTSLQQRLLIAFSRISRLPDSRCAVLKEAGQFPITIEEFSLSKDTQRIFFSAMTHLATQEPRN